MRILIVEPNLSLAEFQKKRLSRDGFTVDVVESRFESALLDRERVHDALVIDSGVLQRPGNPSLRRVRSLGFAGAIIVVGGAVKKAEQIEILDGGADDFMMKPLHAGELAARLRAIHRRLRLIDPRGRLTLAAGPLEVHLLRRQALVAGRPVQLTKTEFDLLVCLMKAPGQVLSHERLVQCVFGAEKVVAPNTLAVHVKNLRSRIDLAEKSFIRTERGCGYAFVA